MILGRPKNIDKYILVDSNISKQLHLLGYEPLYRYDDEIYYIKSEELARVVVEIGNKS